MKDLEQRRRLFESFEDHARSLAHRFAHTRRLYGWLADLTQEALLATWRATESWEPGRGTQFSSWAHTHVAGALRHWNRDRLGMMRAPRTGFKCPKCRGVLTEIAPPKRAPRMKCPHCGEVVVFVAEQLSGGDFVQFSPWPVGIGTDDEFASSQVREKNHLSDKVLPVALRTLDGIDGALLKATMDAIPFSENEQKIVSRAIEMGPGERLMPKGVGQRELGIILAGIKAKLIAAGLGPVEGNGGAVHGNKEGHVQGGDRRRSSRAGDRKIRGRSGTRRRDALAADSGVSVGQHEEVGHGGPAPRTQAGA